MKSLYIEVFVFMRIVVYAHKCTYTQKIIVTVLGGVNKNQTAGKV